MSPDSLSPALNTSNASEVIIVGAGPAGLSMAIALADAGIRCTVLEQASLASIADPQEDGRDIALTHRGRGVFEQLGAWASIPPQEPAPLNAAHVSSGGGASLLHFDTAGIGPLGFLVANHWLRRAVYEKASNNPHISILTDARVEDVRVLPDETQVTLSNGGRLSAQLLIAADSRFSQTRRQVGIGCDMLDFGRTVIVCRMALELEHHGIARECFEIGHTLAILPMNGGQASVGLTVPSSRANEWLALDDAAFSQRVTANFGASLGAMQAVAKRHAYPLVATYAHRFVVPRVALLGDAAVGMHPVTAHGFNFGLYGVQVLGKLLLEAKQAGRDLGSLDVLEPYHREHRQTTWPIYQGTNVVVKWFTDDRPAVRVLRTGVLGFAEHFPPVKDAITRQLTGKKNPWLSVPDKLIPAHLVTQLQALRRDLKLPSPPWQRRG